MNTKFLKGLGYGLLLSLGIWILVILVLMRII
jgi:hypothetical protein